MIQFFSWIKFRWIPNSLAKWTEENVFKTEQKFSFNWVLFINATEQRLYRIAFDKGITAYCGWLKNDTLVS